MRCAAAEKARSLAALAGGAKPLHTPLATAGEEAGKLRHYSRNGMA